MENKNISFQASFGEIQKVNPHVAKVNIRVGHHSKNRNKSNITKEVFQKIADKSLIYTPIIGEWSEEKKNFKGHGGKVVLSDDGVEFVQTTIPFGFIDSDTEMYWQTIREKDGITEHEYLCCTGYLWYGRYNQEIDKLLETGMGQSMELEILDYDFTEDGYVDIKDANFTGLCILGRDYSNRNNHVEPCFPSSEITRYSLDKDEFKTQFALMVQEIKESLQNHSSAEVDNIHINKQEGGNEVEDILKPEFQEEVVAEEVVVTEEVTETVVENEPTAEIEPTLEENHEVIEPENTEVVDESVDYKLKIQEYENKIVELNNQIEELNNKYAEVEPELARLREFEATKLAEERKVAEESLFAQYEQLNGIKAYEELKQNCANYSIADLEKEIALVFVKNTANFSLNEKKENGTIKIAIEHKEVNENPYGDLFERYLGK